MNKLKKVYKHLNKEKLTTQKVELAAIDDLEAEVTEHNQPTEKLGKKPTPKFLNKKDSHGRAYSVEVVCVEVNAVQMFAVQEKGQLLGITPRYEQDLNVNPNNINVNSKKFMGGEARVAKGTEIPEIDENGNLKKG